MSAYDEIAEWYHQSLQSGSPIHAVAVPALMELAGDVRGARICDLACGTGIVARELAQMGARVTGIDNSARLLALAEEQENRAPLGIRYQQGDAQALPEIAGGAFEGIACNLALMDIPDLDACLATIARLLISGGWFVFTITHPCYQLPDSRWTGQAGGTVRREVRGYFREGYWRSSNPYGVRGQVGAYHRMLSTYLNALARAGLALEQVREPEARDEIAGRVPGYREIPVVLAARCCKP